MNLQLRKKENHRAVAPIIATLILVAIAVVGGIMIFVFAQDFFGGTEMTATPDIEVLAITGYDVRDQAALAYHDGSAAAASGAIVTGSCGADDNGVLYVRNSGGSEVTISRVTTNNAASNTFDVDGAPTTGNFSVFAFPDVGAAAALLASGGTIAPGTEASIIFACDTNNVVQNGRTFSIEVASSNGSIFTASVVAGQRG